MGAPCHPTRNLFHPPRSDSPRFPNYTVFTGPRGAYASDLCVHATSSPHSARAALEQVCWQLHSYGAQSSTRKCDAVRFTHSGHRGAGQCSSSSWVATVMAHAGTRAVDLVSQMPSSVGGAIYCQVATVTATVATVTAKLPLLLPQLPLCHCHCQIATLPLPLLSCHCYCHSCHAATATGKLPLPISATVTAAQFSVCCHSRCRCRCSSYSQCTHVRQEVVWSFH